MSDDAYSHRNGETDAPTKRGYYWFSGMAGDEPYEDMITVLQWASGENLVAMGADTTDLLEFKGKWFGPIVPPWDSDHAPA